MKVITHNKGIKQIALVVIAVFFSVTVYTKDSVSPQIREIHSKHFIYGIPKGTPETNDLIIRDCYALSSNDDTKFADWVAYVLNKEIITGNIETTRNWKADPFLDDDETLEPDDYEDAYSSLKLDRGHQAPLASFKGTKCWSETNYLSNITPQKSVLNRGHWKILEDKVRNLAETETVYILTGTLYEHDMPSLPNADEPHKIPSGYWKIIIIVNDSFLIKVLAFIFNQDTASNSKIIDHLVTVDEIEKRSGLSLLSELPDPIENKIESKKDEVLASEFLQ